jgi:FkbM family methyltransferase
LPSADSFIVVGANLGWYPLLAKSVNPNIRVNAFECNSEIFNGLRNNISANNFKDVTLHKIALSSYECRRNLFMPPNGNNGMSTLDLREDEIQNSEFIEEVECARLDSINIDYGQFLNAPVILIDVEGHEFDVLLGALNFISRYKPLIILEINSSMLKAAGKSFLELKLLMESLGYFGFWLDEREKIQGINGNEPPHIQQFGSDHGANYLFTSNLEIISNID